MKQYYHKDKNVLVNEGQSITFSTNGCLFCGIPTEEQLLSWGFEEVEEPQPTEEELIQIAKDQKLEELNEYDSSMEVNSFLIQDEPMWLDSQTRQQLKISVDAYKALGNQTITKWFEGKQFTFPTDTWEYMLAALEVYASEALNITESHRAAIQNLNTLAEIQEYDFTVGYPQKLEF